MLVPIALGLASLRYIIRYPGYREAARDILIRDKLLVDPKATANQNRFRDVKLRDEDFTGKTWARVNFRTRRATAISTPSSFNATAGC